MLLKIVFSEEIFFLKVMPALTLRHGFSIFFQLTTTLECFKPVLLNLKYAYPWGYESRLHGIHIMLNKLKIIPFWSVFCLEFDLGVRTGVQF